ncbi:MAG: hypothetical protein NC428_09465 [Clostridium sp.]|nr:hypothetical protein [Clostridium sp.]
MKRLIIPILIMALFLSGCTSYEERQKMGFINSIYLIELTLNSDFPMQLMRKVELTEIDKKFVSIDTPYVAPDSVNREIDGLGFPYPYDNSHNWYITQICIYVNKYNILGLTVGDDREKIDATMEQFGYTLEYDEGSYIGFRKGELCISFFFGSPPHVTVSVFRQTLDDILSYY